MNTALPINELHQAFSIGLVAILTLFWRRRKKPEDEEAEKQENLKQKLATTATELEQRRPFKVERSITASEATEAKDELRMLELEREVLSDTIRRLYEATVEGKITEEERELLAGRYKSRMMKVKGTISKKESVVALHELESMQEDLMTLFNERFDELTQKIEDLRDKVEVKPSREIVPIQVASAEPEARRETSEKTKKEKPKPKRRAKTESRKTEAEKRIEEIRAEVEKVLDRLGQMEIEG